MCKTLKSSILKAGAKVTFFLLLAKEIAQNRLLRAHFPTFVQVFVLLLLYVTSRCDACNGCQGEKNAKSGRIVWPLRGNYSGAEAVGAYTDGMMLAYYRGDTDLYNKLSDTLGKRVATKSTSPALYMIFREENDRYVFYAGENFATRLATS